MDMPGEINVYADAKGEYTRQLTQFSQPAITSYFLRLLEETKESEKDPRKILMSFQNSLKNVAEWNHEKVQKEIHNLVKDINCDYYEDLLSAVFVAHTKVLSAIRLTSKQKKLQITIPKIEHFLHHTLIECARILWSNVFLFTPSGTSIERQKNLRQIEQLIQDGILQSIRGMLPVKNILKEYLKDDEDDEEKEEEKEVEKEEEKQEEKKEEKEKEVEKEVEKQEEKQEEKKEEKQEEEEQEKVKVDKKKEKEELPVIENNEEPPIINVETEPSVKFTEVDTIIDIEPRMRDGLDEDDELFHVLDEEGTSLEDYEELDKKEESNSIDFESLD
jgi:hypothetical protein